MKFKRVEWLRIADQLESLGHGKVALYIRNTLAETPGKGAVLLFLPLRRTETGYTWGA